MMTNDIEWKMVKLGEMISYLRTGLNPRDNFKLNCADSYGYYITVRELKGFDIITDEKTDRINNDAILKINARAKIKINDVLFSGTGTIGQTAMVKEEPNNWGIKEGIYCITPNEKKLDSRFLIFYLQTPLAQSLFNLMSSGSTIKSVPMEKLKEIEIPIPYKNGVPDLEAQRQIAQKLGDMDNLIAAKEKLLAKKRNLKVAAMQQLIKDEEGENWKRVKLGEVCENFTGLTYSPSDIQAGGTLVLRSSNIKNGFLDFSDNVFVKMNIPKRAIVQKDDILVCVRNGSKFLIGKSALITEIADGMAFGAFMTILRATKINQKFLFYLWQSKSIAEQIQNSLGATINQITNADIKRYEVSIPYKNGTPDLNEQHRIASILSGMDSEIAAIEKEITKLRDLKTAMMQKMFCFIREDK